MLCLILSIRQFKTICVFSSYVLETSSFVPRQFKIVKILVVVCLKRELFCVRFFYVLSCRIDNLRHFDTSCCGMSRRRICFLSDSFCFPIVLFCWNFNLWRSNNSYCGMLQRRICLFHKQFEFVCYNRVWDKDMIWILFLFYFYMYSFSVLHLLAFVCHYLLIYCFYFISICILFLFFIF